MNIGKSWFHVVSVLMLTITLSFGSILFYTCDALSFANVQDGDDDKDNNTDPSEQELPEDDPDASVHIYPPKMFTQAVIRYTNGSFSERIDITSAYKTSFFSIPENNNTIYEVILNPGNISVLIGRKSSEQFNLEFDQNKNLAFRTDQNGNRLYPVPIETYAELAKIYEMQNKDNWAKNSRGESIEPEYFRASFRQKGDIDLFGDIANKAHGTYKEWKPIGIVDDFDTEKHSPFIAFYDGNGKKLYNLSIVTNVKYQGLFAEIGSSGTVINLNINYALVEANSTSAILCAMNAGRIENCFVSDSSLNKAYVNGDVLGLGGICGTNLSGGLIVGCGFIGTVTATDQAGGICGINNGTINAAYFFGHVTGDPDASSIFELTGKNEGGGTTQNSFWYNPTNSNAAGGDKLSTSHWPAFPENDYDPDAGWAEYKLRNTETNGRWKSIGTPSNTPQRSNLPKLWWQN